MHCRVRTQPLHDGKQLPRRQAVVRLRRAVERVEAHHEGSLRRGEGGDVSRHGGADLPAGGLIGGYEKTRSCRTPRAACPRARAIRAEAIGALAKEQTEIWRRLTREAGIVPE